MKNIKLFKYKNTKKFENLLTCTHKSLEDIKGFELSEQKQYCGNTFKEYCIHFNNDDDECAYFKVVCFKSFHEYHQARLGFRGNKLFDWFEDADLREHK